MPSLDSPQMPRPRSVLMSLALGAVCAAALASCGSDEGGEIPPASANVMLAALSGAEDASGQRDCEAIAEAASEVANEAAGLPDSEVRTALIEGAESLDALAKDPDVCKPKGPTGPRDVETTPTTPPPPTETTTTQTTTTTTEETTPKEPPKQPGNEGGGGLGQGNEGGQPPTGGTGGD
jgi:hypothetical protein